MSAPPYYIDVVSCKENCPVVCNHNVPSSLEGKTWDNGSKISPEDKGWIPRGSTTRAEPGNLDLMWILINPGEPQRAIENKEYSEKEGAELADAAWAFTERVLVEGSNRSLKRICSDMELVRGCGNTQVLDYCMLTNVVRCSTAPIWSQVFDGKEGASGLKRKIVQTCSNKHLKREIEYWKPKALLAVGKPARDEMERLDLGWEHVICGAKSRRRYDGQIKRFVCGACKQPVIDWGYIRHPSAERYRPISGQTRDEELHDLANMMGALWD